MFALICVWINGWVNNREAGDLRRHRAHYDAIVMRRLMWDMITHSYRNLRLFVFCLWEPLDYIYIWYLTRYDYSFISLTREIWLLTHEIWLLTHDIWLLTHEIWLLTHSRDMITHSYRNLRLFCILTMGTIELYSYLIHVSRVWKVTASRMCSHLSMVNVKSSDYNFRNYETKNTAKKMRMYFRVYEILPYVM